MPSEDVIKRLPAAEEKTISLGKPSSIKDPFGHVTLTIMSSLTH